MRSVGRRLGSMLTMLPAASSPRFVRRRVSARVDDGQAASVGRDAVAGAGRSQERMGKGEAGAVGFARREGDDGGGALDEPGEHLAIKRGLGRPLRS
jgi:hypothetical protein